MLRGLKAPTPLAVLAAPRSSNMFGGLSDTHSFVTSSLLLRIHGRIVQSWLVAVVCPGVWYSRVESG